MTTRAEALMQALVTALTVPAMTAVPAAHVFRDEEQALEQGVLPSVTLAEGDEPPPERINTHEAERFLEITLGVRAKGSVPFSAADAALLEAHNRVMADQTLGGLSEEIQEGATRRERADLNAKLARVEKTYRIRYRTTDGALT